MKFPKLRSKRLVIPGIAAVAVLGAGGGMWAATASGDLPGPERDRVAEAAVEAVGGGTVIEVEASDDRGEAYEVEVRQDDGTEVEVALDKNLGVVSQDTDDDEADENDEADDSNDGRDDDERALSDAERTQAEKAALAAVAGGTVTDVEASDDRGEAYEVEVRDADGAEWDVELDAEFQVLEKRMDD